MSTFRDALADVLMAQWPNTITRRDSARVTADALLTTPEMQAIRAALWHASVNAARHAYPQGSPTTRTIRYLLTNCALPEDIVNWVMEMYDE